MSLRKLAEVDNVTGAAGVLALRKVIVDNHVL